VLTGRAAGVRGGGTVDAVLAVVTVRGGGNADAVVGGGRVATGDGRLYDGPIAGKLSGCR